MVKNRDESYETQSEYYDSESKRSRRQKKKCYLTLFETRLVEWKRMNYYLHFESTSEILWDLKVFSMHS